ncbi:MAG: hypothetical protein JWM78_3698 [Verrucomicrobiaceae bacterium]|nr:hypothetical protein [Verrucomicrobiaceae bacterium]
MLGQVAFRNPRWYNVPFIALAPLLLLPFALWLYLHETARIPLLHAWHWISLYLVIAAGVSSIPSSIDMRLAWKYSAPLLLAGGVVIFIFMLWLH